MRTQDCQMKHFLVGNNQETAKWSRSTWLLCASTCTSEVTQGLVLWTNISQINKVYTIRDNNASRLQLELACSPQVESDTFKTAEKLL